mgnify:CR=1 FL=1
MTGIALSFTVRCGRRVYPDKVTERLVKNERLTVARPRITVQGVSLAQGADPTVGEGSVEHASVAMRDRTTPLTGSPGHAILRARQRDLKNC